MYLLEPMVPSKQEDHAQHHAFRGGRVSTGITDAGGEPFDSKFDVDGNLEHEWFMRDERSEGRFLGRFWEFFPTSCQTTR